MSACGAPPGIRIRTVLVLSQLSLPVGIAGQMAGTRGLEPLHAIPGATRSFQDYCLTKLDLRARMVRLVELESTRPFGQRILSPLRLPIPP